MSWNIYHLIYIPKGPVHIGYHKLGFIQRTRYYILARNIWGAIASNLTKAIYEDPDTQKYSDIGKEINEHVLISYFYPTFNRNGKNPFIPEYSNTGIRYGELSENRFESIFVRSHTQTAIEPSSVTAEEGSLHETEFILPIVKYRGEIEPIYFVGYIIINNNWEKIDKCLDIMDEICVGGERRYGFGRLRLIGLPELQKERSIFNYPLKEDGSGPLLIIPKGKPIPAHLVADPCLELKGDIEPLVGWDYEKGEYKLRLYHEGKIFWMPGSIPEKELALKIDKFGILTKV